MTINAESLRPGLQQFARDQAPAMEHLQRALAILYRDRERGRSIQEITEIVLTTIARAHERRTEAAITSLNNAMGRVLSDVEATRQAGAGAARLRDRSLRESDLRAIARAADDLQTFEDAVRRRIAAHDEELGRAVEDALRTGAPPAVGALNRARGRGGDIRGLSEAVLEAWRSGHTLPERGIAFAVPHPAEPGLAAAMRKLEEAIDTYRKNPAADAAAAGAAADRLQSEYATANEMLRKAAGDFEAVREGDVVPGRRQAPGAPPRTGANAEVATRADGVRARFAADPHLVEAPRAQLLNELHLSDLDVLAEGGLREPIGRDKLERTLYTPAEILALEKPPSRLATRLAGALAGWQRAHLIGPGFGSELIEGIMLAPEGVNQLVQNKGFEDILRRAHGAGLEVPLTARAKGRRLALPLRDGSTAIVDVLDSVHYEVARAGRPPVVFDITVHPDGSWSATHHGSLDGLWDPAIPLAGH